jgi:hypothetical protein
VKASAETTDGVDLVVLAYVAGQEIGVGEAELNAAVRRALFVFAAGGDLHREPTLDDPAVLELARDLETPERRGHLVAAIKRLDAEPDALEQLRDPELAWRAYACGLLADALGEDDD